MGTTHSVVRDSQVTNHSISNGMVESFHRQLKAALKAQPLPQHWTSSLPIVLLGIRTAFKDDLLVLNLFMELAYSYQETFSLHPRHFPQQIQLLMSRLKSTMQKLHATPPCISQRATCVSLSLYLCTHVFIQHNAVRKPLQTPYDGPYKVLDRYYMADINGQKSNIFLDRLKPAYIESSTAESTDPLSALDDH